MDGAGLALASPLQRRPGGGDPQGAGLAGWLTPTPKVVPAMGTSSARTQQPATIDAAALLAPRDRARSRSQADAQTAHKIMPGITRGTSRRLAHGWSGTVCGCHKAAAGPSR